MIRLDGLVDGFRHFVHEFRFLHNVTAPSARPTSLTVQERTWAPAQPYT
jgi:hypothetical protein